MSKKKYKVEIEESLKPTIYEILNIFYFFKLMKKGEEI